MEMKLKRMIQARAVLGDMDQKLKEKKPKMEKPIVESTLPPGCETDLQRMMRRGEVKKQHIKWGDK